MGAVTDLIFANLSTTTVFLVLIIVIILYLKSKSQSDANNYRLPPGPFSLPLLGTLPFLGVDVRDPLRRLSKNYGDVFTVYFGSRRVIVLNSYEAIKAAFVKQGNLLAGRPQDLFFVKDIQKCKGVISSQGELWKQQRKLTHAILRDFGVGSSFMEDRIRMEAAHLRDLISEHLNEPWDPAYSLQVAVANVIYSVCFGNRNEYSDPWFMSYIVQLNRSFELLSNASVVTVFPSLKHLPGDLFHCKEILEYVRTTREELYCKMVREGKETYQEGTVRDFIDAYLKVMYQEQREGKDTELCDDELTRVLADLLGAGTETSTSTLRWGLVYMLRHPDIQQKVQAEIDEVIGEEAPCMRHRQSMPYTEACLHEIQRIGDVVPLGVPHSTLEDVKLMGYDIPKGTMVISNLYSVHFDPVLWPDPHCFNPGRFLDSDGKLERCEKLIPFSMGKRVCVGESLARMELFLFFVIMLQNFTFELPAGDPLPEQSGKVGMTHMPKPFKLLIRPRK